MKRKLCAWSVIFTLVLFFTGLLAHTASGEPSLHFTGNGWDCETLASIPVSECDFCRPPPDYFGTGESYIWYEELIYKVKGRNKTEGRNITGSLKWTSFWWDPDNGGKLKSRSHEAVLENGKFKDGRLSFAVSYQVDNTDPELPNCLFDKSIDQFNLVLIEEYEIPVLQGGVVGFANFDCSDFWDASELVAVELFLKQD